MVAVEQRASPPRQRPAPFTRPSLLAHASEAQARADAPKIVSGSSILTWASSRWCVGGPFTSTFRIERPRQHPSHGHPPPTSSISYVCVCASPLLLCYIPQSPCCNFSNHYPSYLLPCHASCHTPATNNTPPSPRLSRPQSFCYHFYTSVTLPELLPYHFLLHSAIFYVTFHHQVGYTHRP